MSSRFIKKLMTDIIESNTPILGRWKLDTKQSTKLKIDMANTDHCGTCTFRIVNKKLQEVIKPSQVYYPKDTLK